MDNELSANDANRLRRNSLELFADSIESRRLLESIYQVIKNDTMACKSHSTYTIPMNLGLHYIDSVSFTLRNKGFSVRVINDPFGYKVLSISW